MRVRINQGIAGRTTTTTVATLVVATTATTVTSAGIPYNIGNKRGSVRMA